MIPSPSRVLFLDPNKALSSGKIKEGVSANEAAHHQSVACSFAGEKPSDGGVRRFPPRRLHHQQIPENLARRDLARKAAAAHYQWRCNQNNSHSLTHICRVFEASICSGITQIFFSSTFQ